MSGWIKLHRKVLDNPIVCKDAEHLAIWMYLLLNATHKETPAVFKGEKIMLQPGQLITGRTSISDRLSVPDSKVQRVLKCFELEQQIEQQTSNKNRIISILSWQKYQISEQQNEQQVNNKNSDFRTTERQQNEQQEKLQNPEIPTVSQGQLFEIEQQNEQQIEHQLNNKMNTNKKGFKNVRTKELKNKTINTFDVYTSNSDLISALESFIEFRKSIKKPMTDKAVTLLLRNLDKLASTDSDKVAILEQSILNGWQGIFALKGGANNAVNGRRNQEVVSGIDFGF